MTLGKGHMWITMGMAFCSLVLTSCHHTQVVQPRADAPRPRTAIEYPIDDIVHIQSTPEIPEEWVPKVRTALHRLSPDEIKRITQIRNPVIAVLKELADDTGSPTLYFTLYEDGPEAFHHLDTFKLAEDGSFYRYDMLGDTAWLPSASALTP
ncbi:MAG: hypothetical protein R3B57_04975 [Phycisphaerales bacterium]